MKNMKRSKTLIFLLVLLGFLSKVYSTDEYAYGYNNEKIEIDIQNLENKGNITSLKISIRGLLQNFNLNSLVALNQMPNLEILQIDFDHKANLEDSTIFNSCCDNLPNLKELKLIFGFIDDILPLQNCLSSLTSLENLYIEVDGKNEISTEDLVILKPIDNMTNLKFLTLIFSNQMIENLDQVGEVVNKLTLLEDLELQFNNSQVKSVKGLKHMLQNKENVLDLTLYLKNNPLDDLEHLEFLLVEQDPAKFTAKNGKILNRLQFFIDWDYSREMERAKLMENSICRREFVENLMDCNMAFADCGEITHEYACFTCMQNVNRRMYRGQCKCVFDYYDETWKPSARTYKDTGVFKCVECHTFCASCIDFPDKKSRNCETCKFSHSRDINNECNCKKGYYQDYDVNTKQPYQNCKRCLDSGCSGECKIVEESGEKIVKCLDGCSDALMDPESGCSVCFKGSYYNTSESRCISCQSQFNNQCHQCGYEDGQVKCLKCKTKFSLYDNCQSCESGYYLDSETCFPCKAHNCEFCEYIEGSIQCLDNSCLNARNIDDNCESCLPNYYPSPQGNCITCRRQNCPGRCYYSSFAPVNSRWRCYHDEGCENNHIWNGTCMFCQSGYIRTEEGTCQHENCRGLNCDNCQRNSASNEMECIDKCHGHFSLESNCTECKETYEMKYGQCIRIDCEPYNCRDCRYKEATGEYECINDSCFDNFDALSNCQSCITNFGLEDGKCIRVNYDCQYFNCDDCDLDQVNKSAVCRNSCINNFDINSNCEQCQEGYILENGTCKEIDCQQYFCSECRFNLETKTIECLNNSCLANLTFESNCKDCLQGYRFTENNACEVIDCAASNCGGTCDFEYKVICSGSCLGHFDINQNCEDCVANYKYDIHTKKCEEIDCEARRKCTDCQYQNNMYQCLNDSCLPNLDFETNCIRCNRGYRYNAEEICVAIPCEEEYNCKKCKKAVYGSSVICEDECVNNFDLAQNCYYCIDGYQKINDHMCEEINCTTDHNCTECVQRVQESGEFKILCQNDSCINNFSFEDNCEICKIGFILNTDTHQCEPVQCSDYNCDECEMNDSREILCRNSCNNNFDILENCQLCEIGFQKVSSGNSCQRIECSGYNCQECRENESNQIICLNQCLGEFDFSQNCAVCNQGYYENDQGNCILCSSTLNCERCSKNPSNNEIECDQLDSFDCLNNFDKNFLCKQCKNGYYQDQNICKMDCDIYSENCIECNELSCTRCVNNLYDLSSGCQNCINSSFFNTDCITCVERYFKNLEGNCQSCHYWCRSCHHGEKICKSCSDETRNLGKNCACKEGFFDIGQDVCQKCEKKCRNCEGNSNQCIQCSDEISRNQEQNCACREGFFEDGMATCIPCQDFLANCKICGQNDHNIMKCQACKDHFLLENNCKKCQIGYYIEGDSCLNCSDVEAGCLKCSKQTGNFECLECKQNYDSECKECLEGYYKKDGACLSCENDFNCLKCFVEGENTMCLEGCIGNFDLGSNCQMCKKGYYLNENQGVCEKCSSRNCSGDCRFEGGNVKCLEGCLKGFSISSNCQECNIGQYQQNGVCKQCINGCEKCAFNQGFSFDNNMCVQQVSYETILCDPYSQEMKDKKCKQCNSYGDLCTNCDEKQNRILQKGKCVCKEGFSEVKLECFKAQDQKMAENINTFTETDVVFQAGMTTVLAANPNMYLLQLSNLQQLSFLGNLNVNYPPLARNTLKMFSVFDFQILNDFFTKDQYYRDSIKASEGFEKNEKSAFFIQNSLHYLVIFLIVFVVYLIAKIAAFNLKRMRELGENKSCSLKISEFLVKIMEYQFFIGLVNAGFLNLSVYGFLQIQNSDFGNFGYIFGFSCAVVVLVFYLFYLRFLQKNSRHIYEFLKGNQIVSVNNNNNNNQNSNNINGKLSLVKQQFGLILDNFQEKSGISLRFFGVQGMKKLIFALILVFLNESPLICVLGLQMLSVFSIGVLVYVKPYKNVIVQRKEILVEFMYIVILFCVYGLIGDDEIEYERQMKISKIFFVLVVFILFVESLFSFYCGFLFVRDKFFRKRQVQQVQQEVEESDVVTQDLERKKQFKKQISGQNLDVLHEFNELERRANSSRKGKRQGRSAQGQRLKQKEKDKFQLGKGNTGQCSQRSLNDEQKQRKNQRNQRTSLGSNHQLLSGQSLQQQQTHGSCQGNEELEFESQNRIQTNLNTSKNQFNLDVELEKVTERSINMWQK